MVRKVKAKLVLQLRTEGLSLRQIEAHRSIVWSRSSGPPTRAPGRASTCSPTGSRFTKNSREWAAR